MKNALSVAAFAILSAIFLTACTASKKAAEPEAPKIQPKFDYAPKVLSQVGSANMTIALVNPSYVNSYLAINPFEDMRKNMANDFEELLTAKGFKVRGPFNQWGEMLYNDKVNSDFVFAVEIDLNFNNVDRKRRTVTSTNWGKVLNPYDTGSGTDAYYTYEGEGTVVCNLVLTAMSSKFGEKLWKKNVSLPAAPFKYVGKTRWSSSDATLYDEVQQDNTVYNEIARLLESQYQAIFDLVEKQIDVEEMKTVTVEAKKVDGKQ